MCHTALLPQETARVLDQLGGQRQAFQSLESNIAQQNKTMVDWMAHINEAGRITLGGGSEELQAKMKQVLRINATP